MRRRRERPHRLVRRGIMWMSVMVGAAGVMWVEDLMVDVSSVKVRWAGVDVAQMTLWRQIINSRDVNSEFTLSREEISLKILTSLTYIPCTDSYVQTYQDHRLLPLACPRNAISSYQSSLSQVNKQICVVRSKPWWPQNYCCLTPGLLDNGNMPKAIRPV